MTPTEFQTWLLDGEYECLRKKCSEEVDLITPVRLECYICAESFDFDTFDEARELLEERCESCCGRNDFDEHSICVANSWQLWYGVHHWTANGQDVAELERKGRSDYWEAVVHFCDVHEFISIYKDREIRSHSTGYFFGLDPAGSKAVCLSEATKENWIELKKLHGDYGYIFRKRDIIKQGGRPAIFLPDAELQLMKHDTGQFSKHLRPFVNLLRIKSVTPGKKKIDYLHEREWRVARSISLDATKPCAVVFPQHCPKVPDALMILHAAREFQELYSFE